MRLGSDLLLVDHVDGYDIDHSKNIFVTSITKQSSGQ
jgi:hypothetical protein